jgi:hypothetical protein
MPVLRNLDLVLLALALPVFLATGLPVMGWVTAAVIWGLWRGIGEWSDRRVAASTSPKQTAGIAAGSMVGRGWLLGLILLASGLAFDDETGLSAAVLVLALFTVHFTFKLAFRGADPQGPATT